jgi:hypothetical protein
MEAVEKEFTRSVWLSTRLTPAFTPTDETLQEMLALPRRCHLTTSVDDLVHALVAQLECLGDVAH